MTGGMIMRVEGVVVDTNKRKRVSIKRKTETFDLIMRVVFESE